MKKAIKTVAYYATKCVTFIVFKLYFRLKFVGMERVPGKGGLLIAANHLSYADPPVLGCVVPRRISFIMSEGQFMKPGLHFFSRLMDVIPVATGASFKIGPFKKALHRLKRGGCLVIFPEGRRSATGRMLEGLPGLGKLAVRSGAPILPVAIVGTRDAYPVGSRFPKPKRVSVFVGTPLECGRKEAPELITSRTMEAIANLLIENGYSDYVKAPGETNERSAIPVS